MNINLDMKQHKWGASINFKNLMKLYESNYHLVNKMFSSNSVSKNKFSAFVGERQVLQYEPIAISKYTSIFKLYFKFQNFKVQKEEYYIKPHIIFTLYNDAKLLEAKTIKQSRDFDCSIKEKFKTNLAVLLWLKTWLRT